jgi:hypothetical protein
MTLERPEPLRTVFSAIGRYFFRRLEMPLPNYQKRIINNMENLYRVIQPGDILLVEGRSLWIKTNNAPLFSDCSQRL